MSEKHQVPSLSDQWEQVEQVIALSNSKGSNKRMVVRVRFDGRGNSVVRFIVLDHGHEETYEKFDSACFNYNRAE
jgi:hypothetical protein